MARTVLFVESKVGSTRRNVEISTNKNIGHVSKMIEITTSYICFSIVCLRASLERVFGNSIYVNTLIYNQDIFVHVAILFITSLYMRRR